MATPWLRAIASTCSATCAEHGPDLHLDLHTNGSARRPQWWRELAEIMKSGPHYLRFGIDGLADTNHPLSPRHRLENSDAQRAAFIEAGGRAEWDFLVFRHNEHRSTRHVNSLQTWGSRNSMCARPDVFR